ncbi:hypothetical protein AWB82_03796 [Caballeronia glebae]|uniref:Uncharacterized protein n=1 Tax=Caballeronia glebae TaxID=1777143 RepID=A0A158BA14_9BURK|nr:hypothetical protein AWB82_03796 [Caballeronia glebae]
MPRAFGFYGHARDRFHRRRIRARRGFASHGTARDRFDRRRACALRGFRLHRPARHIYRRCRICALREFLLRGAARHIYRRCRICALREFLLRRAARHIYRRCRACALHEFLLHGPARRIDRRCRAGARRGFLLHDTFRRCMGARPPRLRLSRLHGFRAPAVLVLRRCGSDAPVRFCRRQCRRSGNGRRSSRCRIIGVCFGGSVGCRRRRRFRCPCDLGGAILRGCGGGRELRRRRRGLGRLCARRDLVGGRGLRNALRSRFIREQQPSRGRPKFRPAIIRNRYASGDQRIPIVNF